MTFLEKNCNRLLILKLWNRPANDFSEISSFTLLLIISVSNLELLTYESEFHYTLNIGKMIYFVYKKNSKGRLQFEILYLSVLITVYLNFANRRVGSHTYKWIGLIILSKSDQQCIKFFYSLFKKLIYR